MTSLSNAEINSNSESPFDQISMDDGDVINNFTIVPNSLIRDISISPECRWLIIYLISNKPGWKIKTKQIWEHVKEFIGRDKVLKRFKEAIEAGYISRNEITRNVNGKFLRGFEYKVSSTPKFKKCLRKPEIQDPEDQEPNSQGSEFQGSKEILSLRKLSRENNTSLKVSSPDGDTPSADGSDTDISSSKKKREYSEKIKDIAKRFIQILSTHDDTYRPPRDLNPIWRAVHLLIEEDSQDPEKLFKLLEYAAKDREERGGFKGWATMIYSKKGLSEKFRNSLSTINASMRSAPKRDFAPCSDMDATKEAWKKAMENAL